MPSFLSTLSLLSLLVTTATTNAQHQQQADSDSSLLDVYNAMELDPSDYTIHDPSRIITVGNKQLIAVTGKAQEDGYDCGIETWWRNTNNNDRGNWKPGQCLFRTKPDWVRKEAPLNDGTYII